MGLRLWESLLIAREPITSLAKFRVPTPPIERVSQQGASLVLEVKVLMFAYV
jgi:hypothetical protein